MSCASACEIQKALAASIVLHADAITAAMPPVEMTRSQATSERDSNAVDRLERTPWHQIDTPMCATSSIPIAVMFTKRTEASTPSASTTRAPHACKRSAVSMMYRRVASLRRGARTEQGVANIAPIELTTTVSIAVATANAPAAPAP